MYTIVDLQMKLFSLMPLESKLLRLRLVFFIQLAAVLQCRFLRSPNSIFYFDACKEGWNFSIIFFVASFILLTLILFFFVENVLLTIR